MQFSEGIGHTVNKVVLRMDDVGASTKRYEVYSKIPFGNFLFLKYLPFFRAWGVYREIDSKLWSEIFDFLVKENAKLSIAITASWVEKDGRLVPFPEKFPKESKLIKEALRENIIEISNHGLTHCVVGKHQPRLFSSNRKYHREFWDWLPQEIHNQHIEKSQKIFEEWLGESPKILVPPGNVYSGKTLIAAEKYGIEKLNSSRSVKALTAIEIYNENGVDAFHDREIVLYGKDWLFRKILDYKKMGTEFIFIDDLKNYES